MQIGWLEKSLSDYLIFMKNSYLKNLIQAWQESQAFFLKNLIVSCMLTIIVFFFFFFFSR